MDNRGCEIFNSAVYRGSEKAKSLCGFTTRGFAKMLNDLTACVHPWLTSWTALWQWRERAPRRVPQRDEVLYFLPTHRLDATFCRMIHLDPKLVLSNKVRDEIGVGTYLAKDIENTGDPGEFYCQGILSKPGI